MTLEIKNQTFAEFTYWKCLFWFCGCI